jgi:hypothetical protein
MLPALSNRNAGLQQANERIAATETATNDRAETLKISPTDGEPRRTASYCETSLIPITSSAMDGKPGIAS